MPSLSWYWNRLRAMEPGELPKHLRRKVWQMRNSVLRQHASSLSFATPRPFPGLTDPSAAPELLRKTLRDDADKIRSGRWRLFGELELQVDDPPRWHRDYLAGIELSTAKPGRQLNHRDLPSGADIRLIWELSRWHPLVRLAQAAYILHDHAAGRKCVDWLDDWTRHNPPFAGWNWISALESGLRLIQFAWIDALLCPSPQFASDLKRLRETILSAHAAFTWNCRSFGSSANNHLIGELAGLMVATARWPELARCDTNVESLHAAWEAEVVAQFSDDGGNKEQALNYHLFAWELCWQARSALKFAGREVSPSVEERLERAARFYCEVQATSEPWDYGDSDNSRLLPLFLDERSATQEWCDWVRAGTAKTAYEFWLGARPDFQTSQSKRLNERWSMHPKTGIAICESGFWWLRWDLSPLGYLKPAAHGHLDAEHLSVWYNGVALIIDPGTGAYYSDARLRAWLASRAAHNGPCVAPAGEPNRLGPFLWSYHHLPPVWRLSEDSQRMESELPVGTGRALRSIERVKPGDGWVIIDSFEPDTPQDWSFTVRWQFAPDTLVKTEGERKFQISRRGVAITLEVDASWAEVRMVERALEREPTSPPLAGVVSPSFRRATFAPYVALTARRADKPCVFRTTFLACEPR